MVAALVGKKMATNVNIDDVGTAESEIPVELSVRFLEHFSESLYSSPQKAFEELVSNGWDAGADCVDIRIPEDLTEPDATLCVLDNGASMDAEGLRELWHIAFSPKEGQESAHGRRLIGKFGIGKLATYVLAKKLTYICKSSDGAIRRVTMDYGDIEKQRGQTLINALKLPLFNVSETELSEALSAVDGGQKIIELIEDGIPKPAEEDVIDEFGGPASEFKKPDSDTWTIAILSDLKTEGRNLKRGVLKRMLEAALPIGSEMAICINGERLKASKLSVETQFDWEIGSQLKIDELEISETDEQPTGEEDSEATGTEEDRKEATETLKLATGDSPVPYIEIPEVGKVYGRVRLYRGKISGGKSAARGDSNGFHVNVLGRLINQSDPSFGEENLSHAAWSRFRMTVRCDGLNKLLTTDREKLKEGRELKIFRAFLRKVFNRARTHYDADENAALPDGGDVLVKSLGVISLNPLRNVVSETLKSTPPIPGLFEDDVEGDQDNREQLERDWWEKTSDNIRNAVKEIKYEKSEDDSFVRFRLSDSSIVINKEHPFVADHTRTKSEKELMRTIAMVDFLTDVYALDSGIRIELLKKIRGYRDKLLRYKAMERRASGTHIAELLRSTQHDSENSKHFEVIVGDALEYLGFRVRRLGNSGQPEGVASAYTLPTDRAPTDDDSAPPLYTFTYDAKSSKHPTASTGNLNLSGIANHRQKHEADHALVVAPGFQVGGVTPQCETLEITPMTGTDLGRLLELTFRHGAIPLATIRRLFKFHDPGKVTECIDTIESEIVDARKLTIDVFIRAIKSLEGKIPDVLQSGTIAKVCRDEIGVKKVVAKDVETLVRGLSILVSDLLAIEGSNVVVNVSAERLANAIESQLEAIDHDDS